MTTTTTQSAQFDAIMDRINRLASDEPYEQPAYLIRGSFEGIVAEINAARLHIMKPAHVIGLMASWTVDNGEIVALDFGASVSVNLCINARYQDRNVASPVLAAFWYMIGEYFGERGCWDNESMIQGYLPEGIGFDVQGEDDDDGQCD